MTNRIMDIVEERQDHRKQNAHFPCWCGITNGLPDHQRCGSLLHLKYYIKQLKPNFVLSFAGNISIHTNHQVLLSHGSSSKPCLETYTHHDHIICVFAYVGLGKMELLFERLIIDIGFRVRCSPMHSLPFFQHVTCINSIPTFSRDRDRLTSIK